MTPAEIQAECDYRHAERLGILCGPVAPSPAQLAIANSEVRAYRAAQQPPVAAGRVGQFGEGDDSGQAIKTRQRAS